MTRLSDSLRGLADRAPLDAVSVSTSGATRRIKRNRRLHATANATAGLGAAAVIALAAINPGMDTLSSADSAPNPESATSGDKAMAPAYDAAGSSQLAWGLCGSRPFDYEVPMASDAFTLTLGEMSGEVEPGSTATAQLTFLGAVGADLAYNYTAQGTAFLVLWDGMVVGTGQDTDVVGTQGLSDDTASWESAFDLVNCWDGTPLPGGAYELVAFQDFYPEATTDPVDPTVAPSEPTLAPTEPSPPIGAPDEPTPILEETAPAPGEPGVIDGGAATGGDAATSGATDAVVPAPGFIGPAADAPALRVVSNHVALAVSGDTVENPFGPYIDQPAPAVVYPDDYLDPATARAEFAARAVNGTWDMAAGTQRVTKTGDSLGANNEDSWLEGYYGCSADGTTTPGFPATSADWPLLKVDAKLPGSVGVSYGWVVDGNPEVRLSITNTSGYTLPGFWGQPNSTLYLVKDGKVVATSYLSPTDPYGLDTASSTDGMLTPDGSLSDTFLWRDVNGCWMSDSQSTVSPGTYTVLSEQDIYLDNGSVSPGGPIYYEDGAKRSIETPALGMDTSVTSSGAAADASIGIAPAPGPDGGDFDWLSFQVWTSLGTVTVR